MRKLLLLLLAGGCAIPAPAANVDLKESKFTQVVNDVQIISTADNAKHPAAVDGLFKMPDVLRTGAASRAEMVAEDRTITRVGANTIFSFDPANRSIDLKQGSLLFNSPKGKGGGSIHTAAATAAVLGTTIIVVTTPDGGFKVLTLEGVAEVRFLKGLTRRLRAGQLIFVLPGGVPGPILAFRLDQLVAGSRLVSGFDHPLPSLALIDAQIARQIQLITSGRAQDTGLFVGDQASPTTVQVINVIQTLNGGTNAALDGINPGGSGNNIASGGIPVAPPGTIVPDNGGFLTPDGFVFTSFSTNDGPGPDFAAGPATATLSDATISAATLDATRVFTGGVQVTIPLQDDFNGFISGGFFARNLAITSPVIDLSPFAELNLQNFIFFASENMTIANSLMLTPLASQLIFFAGGQLNISSGVSITANSPLLELGSRSALSLDTVTIANAGQNVALKSFGTISLINTAISSNFRDGNSLVSVDNSSETANGRNMTVNNSTLTADNVALSAGGTLTVSGTAPDAGQVAGTTGVSLTANSGMTVGLNISADPQAGSIAMFNTAGLLTVNNGTRLSALTINLDSPGGVLIDSIAAPQAGTMGIGQFSPGGTTTIQNSDLSNLGALNVNAQTIVLNNVNLPSSGNSIFTPGNHAFAPSPNTGQAVVAGDLNFINNVRFNGALANTPGTGFQVR